MIAKLVARMKHVQMTTLLRISAGFTIIGLAMMVWSLLVPTPLPVMLAMSAGQAFGMIAFGLYTAEIVIDLQRERRRAAQDGRHVNSSSRSCSPARGHRGPLAAPRTHSRRRNGRRLAGLEARGQARRTCRPGRVWMAGARRSEWDVLVSPFGERPRGRPNARPGRRLDAGRVRAAHARAARCACGFPYRIDVERPRGPVMPGSAEPELDCSRGPLSRQSATLARRQRVLAAPRCRLLVPRSSCGFRLRDHEAFRPGRAHRDDRANPGTRRSR